MDNRDEWYGRIGITARPTDDIENYVVADDGVCAHQWHRSDPGPVQYQQELPAPGIINYGVNSLLPHSPAYYLALQQSLGVRQIAGFYGPLFVGKRQVTYNFPGPIEKAENFDIADILKWDITDDIGVKNILGYVNSRQLTRSDFTDTPIVGQGFFSPSGWNSASVGAGGGSGLVTQYSRRTSGPMAARSAAP